MTSYYSLLQAALDPVADERINLGLLAMSDGEFRIQFTRDLSRASVLLGDGVSRDDVERMLDSIREDIEPVLASADAVQVVRDLADSWQHSVRITTPRASTLELDALMASIVERALHSGAAAARTTRVRDRRAAVSLARTELEVAVKSGPKALKVARRVRVQGARQGHSFPVGLANSQVRLGVCGLSFEGGLNPAREQQLGALKWLVDDVKSHYSEFPISVVVLDRASAGDAQDSLDVLEDLGAEIVTESEIVAWASRAVLAAA